jgi:hypothetical protein
MSEVRRAVAKAEKIAERSSKDMPEESTPETDQTEAPEQSLEDITVPIN